MLDYPIPDPCHTIDGRRAMRSMADALEALRCKKRFFPHSLAQVRTAPIKLPTGLDTSIVLVVGEPYDGQPDCAVALPSSASFTAKRASAADPQQFEISLLDRAVVDDGGTVELSDGTRLRRVNVVPTEICRSLTEIQKRIVYWTLKCIDAEAKCYREGPPTPDLRFLDYSTLYGLNLPTLKAIAHYIAKRDFTLRNAAHQTIADALSVCGLRRPRSGRLAN